MIISFYDVLGVADDASTAEIKAAYRRAARALHPDMKGTERQFRLVRTAYEALIDPAQRAAHDAALAGHHDDTAAEPDPAPEWGDEDRWTDDAPAGQGATPGPRSPASPSSFVTSAQPTWVKDLRDVPVQAVPSFSAHRRPALIATAVLAALCGALATVWFLDRAWLGGAASLLPLAWAIPRRVPARRLANALRAMSVVAMAFGAFVIVEWISFQRSDPAPGSGLLLAAAGGLFLVVVVLAYVLVRRRDRVVALNKEIGPSYVRNVNLFGRPDRSVSVRHPSPRPHVAAVRRDTAEMLEAVLKIPGSKLVHGLPMPGTADTIDHALVAGKQVALVWVREWPTGTYRADSYGNLVVAGAVRAAPEVADALAGWRGWLPSAQVAGYVLIRPVVPGAVHCDLTTQDVTYLPWNEGVERLGHWLLPGAGVVDRRLLARILNRDAR